MLLSAHEKARAVLFFGEEGIIRELLYSEFEALLDSFVPLKDWAGSVAKATYVEIDSSFNVVAAVFCLIGFDSQGNVEASWNIPLAELARTAHKGPDLGSGPIHLACASHCPVTYYQQALWDPDPGADGLHFDLIQKFIKRNKLGIRFKDAPVQETASRSLESDVERERLLSRKYEREMREQAAELLQEQKLRLINLENEKESTIAVLKREYAEQLNQMQAQLGDAQKRSQELKDTITGQAQKIEGLREYYEHKLERLQAGEDDVPELAGGLISQVELDARIQAATQELREQLRMKQVELQYRVGLEEQMQAELARLRKEIEGLQAESATEVLAELSRKGVSFVTHQVGAGHITIPISEIDTFRQNPLAFTAAYCDVDEAVYTAWLRHYRAPVCAFIDEAGRQCAANIERVATPSEFVAGVSEYCERHQSGEVGATEASPAAAD